MRLLDGELNWFGAVLIAIAIFLLAGVGPMLLVARDMVSNSTGVGETALLVYFGLAIGVLVLVLIGWAVEAINATVGRAAYRAKRAVRPYVPALGIVAVLMVGGYFVLRPRLLRHGQQTPSQVAVVDGQRSLPQVPSSGMPQSLPQGQVPSQQSGDGWTKGQDGIWGKVETTPLPQAAQASPNATPEELEKRALQYEQSGVSNPALWQQAADAWQQRAESLPPNSAGALEAHRRFLQCLDNSSNPGGRSHFGPGDRDVR
jgi:hypothetical protein